MNIVRTVCIAVALGGGLICGGCGVAQELGIPLFVTRGRSLYAEPGETRPERMIYPDQAPVARPLPIGIIRKDRALIIDNQTARVYRDVVLWLNHQYGARIDKIPIGRGEPIALRNFINRYGEPFPTSKPLQPQTARPLLMADLEIDGKLHKLVVRLEEGWREYE